MSNRLIRLAQRVRTLSIGDETRAIWPSEKAVLTALADDARDAEGGVARLAIAEIALRTGINRRTVEVALRHLADAGLIERDGRPGRATARTFLRIEPAATSGVDSGQTRIHTGSDPNPHRVRPESDSGVESTNKPIDHFTSARAAQREEADRFERVMTPSSTFEPPAPTSDPAEQVFAAWDAMAAASGLPGPVRRDVERRAAIERRIAGEKLWRVLQAVRAVGDAPYLTRRKRSHDGQGDVMADFDFVFGVGHLRGNRVFERLLEGSFTGGRAIPVDAPAPVAEAEARPPPPVRPPAESVLLARMTDRIGAAAVRSWIEPLAFEPDGDGLRILAPSAFHADHVRTHFADQLQHCAWLAFGLKSVRVQVREKV